MMQYYNEEDYLQENNPLLKENVISQYGMEVLPSPFNDDNDVPYEGVFISNDGGNTGVFITDDKTFDSGQYQSVGDVYEVRGFTILEVF